MPVPTKPVGAALLAVALLGASACSSDDSTTDTAGAGSGTTQPPASELPPGTEDLEGRWAHFDVVAYDDPTMKTLIISTGFTDLEVRDGELWSDMTFCHADMGNDANIEVTMPDAATRAIVPVPAVVEVTEGPDGTLQINRPPTPTPIGIQMEDPANEMLPTDPNDPRIFDHDGDGNPGVSAHIRVAEGIEGDLYIARREIFEYDVTQESPDRFAGTITDSSEQLVLGASDPVFDQATEWVQLPDPARNPVIWERVDEDWDCERLAAERDELFPPNPQADW